MNHPIIHIFPEGPCRALACLCLAILLACPVSSAEVQVGLSSRETYVNSPIALQIAIVDAAKYEQPDVPTIEGCDIQSLGTQSSRQIMGFGSRSQTTQSVTLQYSITPRREGNFEVPSMTLIVDGREVKTEPQGFVVIKSETGDLLFVELEGEKDSVFVGQSLDLTLKIWIKPFEDQANRIRLSEANMWQMLSEETSWGSFTERMKELADRRQAPEGREVLRDNGQGTQRSYYLYEISATIYPKRPGRLGSEGVQIIVHYPLEIGRARDPFANFFSNSPFAQDDFFSSPFSRQLTITKHRTISAEAASGELDVLAIPTAGRPADYRGAVGRYQIVTQATPKEVAVGDPITLNIGIAGTGPMELLQAPPLTESVQLTQDFKVADQSLAGFVQDETKLFSTSIRARRAGITQIPPIAFSYFDPDLEEFETVYSDPISITVAESELLDLDAVLGSASAQETRPAAGPDAEPIQLAPDFTNYHSADVLDSPLLPSATHWWWAFVFGPPVVWLVVLLVQNIATLGKCFSNLKTARRQCWTAMARAQQPEHIVSALVRYVARRLKQPCTTPVTAVGALRAAGFYPCANELESLFENCVNTPLIDTRQESQVAELRVSAIAWVTQLESALAETGRFRIRNAKALSKSLQRTSLFWLPLLLATMAGRSPADEPNAIEAGVSVNSQQPRSEALSLSAVQQGILLKEAGEVYARALELKTSDPAESNETLSVAAEKYQLLIASGIRSGPLWMNLGNTYLQRGQLGRAIACYERARPWLPKNRQLKINLEFAESQVNRPNQAEALHSSSASEEFDRSWLSRSLVQLRKWNSLASQRVGPPLLKVILAVSSLLFWGVLIVRAAGLRLPVVRLTMLPFLALGVSIASVTLSLSQPPAMEGVLVAKQLTLYAGDGEQFSQLATLSDCDGQRVAVLAARSDWTQIETTSGQIGWVSNSDIEQL